MFKIPRVTLTIYSKKNWSLDGNIGGLPELIINPINADFPQSYLRSELWEIIFLL